MIKKNVGPRQIERKEDEFGRERKKREGKNYTTQLISCSKIATNGFISSYDMFLTNLFYSEEMDITRDPMDMKWRSQL